MFDNHIHTEFSSDSRMKIEEVLERIKELNIGATITEHLDLNFPIPGKFIFDIEDYFNRYEKHKSDKLLLGIEMGMRMDCIDKNKEVEKKYPFDYILGSIHMVNNMDIYYEEFYEGKTKREAYEEYFKVMLDCVKAYDFIDSMGHIDYISRYSRYEEKEIYMEEFSEYIIPVLKALIGNGTRLEINTRRLNDKAAALNLIKIFRSYYELGGREITIGSDAHNAKDIGNSFNIAREIADSCNLRIIRFIDRNIQYIH